MPNSEFAFEDRSLAVEATFAVCGDLFDVVRMYERKPCVTARDLVGRIAHLSKPRRRQVEVVAAQVPHPEVLAELLEHSAPTRKAARHVRG